MNKIERIEKLLEKWKAAELKAADNGDYSTANINYFKRRGGEAALAILKEPSNTRIHMGSLKPGEPCSHPGCCNHITHPCEGCGRVGCQ